MSLVIFTFKITHSRFQDYTYAVISMFTDEVIRDSTTSGTGSDTRELCSEWLI